MKIFRQLIVVILLLLPSVALAESMLVVNMTDGSRRTFLLAELPKVQMVGEDLVITSASASATIPRSNVLRFTFEEVPVGVDNVVTAPDCKISVLDDKVSVSGCTGRVAMVAMNGAVVRQSECDATGCCTILLSGIPAGTYLVQTSVQTLKIFIR